MIGDEKIPAGHCIPEPVSRQEPGDAAGLRPFSRTSRETLHSFSCRSHRPFSRRTYSRSLVRRMNPSRNHSVATTCIPLAHSHIHHVTYPANDITSSDSTFLFKDPGQSSGDYIDQPPCQLTSAGAGPALTWRVPSLPQPVHPKDLYRNLLALSSCHHPSVTLPELVSYHEEFADQPYLYSAKSFNFLVALAIRHSSFGLAQTLLKAMRITGIRPNLESHKLTIRWLIRTGKWSIAWKSAMELVEPIEDRSPLTSSSGKRQQGMPLSIWLEFFGTVKNRAFRSQPDPVPESSEERKLNIAIASARFRMLMQHLPMVTASERSNIPPRVVYHVVQMMLHLGRREAAKTLTQHYLKNLPKNIDARCVRSCLCIIHLHVMSPRGRAVSAHFNSRKTVDALLALHPRLRPNSTTLFLILGHLKGARLSGSFAKQCVSSYTKTWGSKLVDQRVRRRVVSLALKQGRVDIARTMLTRESMIGHHLRILWPQLGASGEMRERIYRGTRRRWAEQIFGKTGKEIGKWVVLKRKFKKQKEDGRPTHH